MVIQVESYSGFKADERPVRFCLGERWLQIEEILDRWYDPDAIYFRVRAEDAGIYILRYSGPESVWTLQAYRDPKI